MNKLFLFFLLVVPSLSFASFPVQLNYSDTIRKDGKVYIAIENNNNEVSIDKKTQVKLKENNQKLIHQNRNRTIVGSIGAFFIIGAIIVVILFVILVRAFWVSLNS